MFGKTNQSYLDKIMVTLFFGLLFTFGSAFAEVTGTERNDWSMQTRDVQTCRVSIPTSRITTIYRNVNGRSMGYQYAQGTELAITYENISLANDYVRARGDLKILWKTIGVGSIIL